MSNYKKHAIREFRAAGFMDENEVFCDDWQQLICEQVMGLLDMFAEHGHSGSTAPYAIEMFKKLASFEPLVPLTGEDFEWTEVGEGRYQNNRCSHVFKDFDRYDGQAYDIEGKVFWEWSSHPDIDNGQPFKSYYTCGDSHTPITFPYTPKREYVERESGAST